MSCIGSPIGKILIGEDFEPHLRRMQSYYDSGGWRGTWALDGGGALMNQAVHTVDLAGRRPGQLSDAHRRQYLNFLGALDGTGELRVDLATNRRPIAVTTGAFESARTGRPVRL